MQYEFDWSLLLTHGPLLIDGLVVTVKLTLLSALVGFTVGGTLGILRGLGPRWIRPIIGGYVEVFRNIPPIVILFFLYFGLQLPLWIAAVSGLGLAGGAQVAETLRSGINGVPKAQREAGSASGLTPVDSAIKVVVPQAFLIVIPVLGLNFISMIKNSSIAMTIGLAELTFQTREINALTFRGIEAASAGSAFYLGLSLTVVTAVSIMERLMRIRLRTP